MKKIYKLCLYIIVSILIELIILGIYNYNYMSMCDNKKISYVDKQVEFYNWDKNESGYISKTDPIIIIPNLNMYVDNVKIKFKSSQQFEYIDFFYKTKKNETFNMLNNFSRINTVNYDIKEDLYSVKYTINSYVKDLRVDLGDKPDRFVEDVSMEINFPIKFSIARVIAIFLIIISSEILFKLQKNQTYRIWF